MPSYLWSMLSQAFQAIPSSLGSNWLGLTFPLLIAIVSEIIAILIYGWRTMVQNWNLPTKIALLSAFTGYCLLFCWCFVVAIYSDHAHLLASNTSLRSALEKYKTGDVVIRIKGAIANQNQHNEAIVQMWLSIDNNGQPTILRDWTLKIATPQGDRFATHTVGQQVLKSSLNIPFLDTEFQKPVGIVADFQGYVTFAIPKMSHDEFVKLSQEPSADLIISAVDSKGIKAIATKNFAILWNEGHEIRPAH